VGREADYFARRIAADDLTGVHSAAENEKGLADAHAWFSRLDAMP
jgi:homoserine kinase type II